MKVDIDISEVPMVRLTWRDAQDSDGAWTDIEEIVDHRTATCQEVGWLVYNNLDRVIVMRSRIVEANGALKEGGAHIAIPKSWVLKIEELEVK